MTELATLLDELVPAGEERGDWAAVLAASGLARPRRVTRKRLVLALAAIGAVAAVAVTPAFGLRDLLLELVGRTPVSFDRSSPAPAAVKKRFLDLFGEGAPRGMNPGVMPGEARQIEFRGAGGRKRVLWVAPTRSGGFCSILDGAGGGCITRQSETRVGPLELGGAYSEGRGGPMRIVEVDGHVYSARIASLALQFQDGSSLPLPFVYVSKPIGAGFFIAGVPSDHQTKGAWPTEVVARDAAGAVVATRPIAPPQLPRSQPGTFAARPPEPFPAAPRPTAPVQFGEGSGASAVAGANGAVHLTFRNLPATSARLLRGRISVSCFRLTREFGILTVRGDGSEGAYAPAIGLLLNGVGHPLDGCDVESGRGHRWPDALGSHSPVEIAFTARGRAFFADRAAARDLAAFVRQGRMQRIRHEPGPELARDMRAAYGAALARSRIRWTLTPDGIVFAERSPTGKVFRVVVRSGRIAKSNVELYASVH